LSFLSGVSRVTVPEFDPGSRRLLGASALAGASIGVASVAYTWSRLFLNHRSLDRAGAILPGVLAGWISATVVSVPFLLAVLVVVAGPTRRSVAGGAVLVYAFDLLVTVGWTSLRGFPGGIELAVLAVPLARVVSLLAVATAVWLAYHGGYDRLVSAAGNATRHPLFAVVADSRLGPALPLRRGLVAAGIAAIVGAAGLVVVGGIADLLGALARVGTAESSIAVFSRDWVRDVGIPAARLPVEWLFEASFLLAVLFVTGPRLRLRDLLKGLAVVFGVQSTVHLLPMLLPPFDPVYLLGSPGPVLTPLGDAILLSGVAAAVRLGFHGDRSTAVCPHRPPGRV
jgi:hypothetical protein